MVRFDQSPNKATTSDDFFPSFPLALPLPSLSSYGEAGCLDLSSGAPPLQSSLHPALAASPPSSQAPTQQHAPFAIPDAYSHGRSPCAAAMPKPTHAQAIKLPSCTSQRRSTLLNTPSSHPSHTALLGLRRWRRLARHARFLPLSSAQPFAS
ncbi:hypothetical protein B0H19DRAFT_1259326 [Mycena capillaripes]|nr:hypothetical protein B0H19DRAFT_1259326 [Mycena capillaripes]